MDPKTIAATIDDFVATLMIDDLNFLENISSAS